MKKIDKTPLWVELAYANIHTRKTAMWLIIACALFTLYCVPWVKFTNSPIVATLFQIEDWEWLAMMLPMTIWYWVSLKWVDKHQGWETE